MTRIFQTLTLCALYACIFSACATGPTLLADQIIGKWDMQRIVQDGTSDVSSEHNPEGDRYIIFNADNTFESGGAPYGKNTGAWTLDQDSGELFLNSDAGMDDDSYWIVRIEGNAMFWQGARFEFNKRFSIEHKRGE